MQGEKSGKTSVVGEEKKKFDRDMAFQRHTWLFIHGQETSRLWLPRPRIASAILLLSIGFQPKRGNVTSQDPTTRYSLPYLSQGATRVEPFRDDRVGILPSTCAAFLLESQSLLANKGYPRLFSSPARTRV